MRGLVFGYVAEFKLRKLWFSDPRVSRVTKPSDHDRARKQDLVLFYHGTEITVEVKSLQSKTVRILSDGTYTGKFQCDASDKRPISLPSGEMVTTTCLKVGEFDLIAACLFEFGQKWRFAFAHNRDLPRSTFRGYTDQQREYLLATLVSVTWPPQHPFVADPFGLMDEIVADRFSKLPRP